MKETKPESVNPQSTQLFPPPVATEFYQDENIDDAFTKLSAALTDIIQHTNFNRLQRACIEKARSPKMLHKSSEVIPFIKEADSFEKLCSMLADTTYWNFLDIRMMEAMATASMIPAAKETIENFKKTFFSMTLKKAAPYFPVISVKPNHFELHEILDRDPSQMTIGELHEHRFYLETEILKTGSDTCTICRIKIGSVEIVWQIHGVYAYQMHSRLKKAHPQYLSSAIRFMSVPEMEKWEGLPFQWPGQDLNEVGPIKLPDYTRREPYPLPQGFEWCVIDTSNSDELVQLLVDGGHTCYISKNFFEWCISNPQYKKEYIVGIRISLSKQLASCIFCIPYSIRVGGKLISMVRLEPMIFKHIVNQKQQEYQLYNSLIKETMRLLQYEKIFQALLFTSPYYEDSSIVPKPFVSYYVYFWIIRLHTCHSKYPQVTGLRRMKASDVPKVFALTNQYTSQFEIGQVFLSEEEFSHWFLNPLHDNVKTYVVEEPKTGIITDMFSLKCGGSGGFTKDFLELIAVTITKYSDEQFVNDLLMCAIEQEKATVLLLRHFGLKEDLFKDYDFVKRYKYCHFYNYKYPEVDETNCCIFGISP